jgi:hypothetical protein
MEFVDNNVCLKAFNELCEELNDSKLVRIDECQYWVFESGYKAALEELINNISVAAKSQNQISFKRKYLVKETVSH